MSASTLLAFAPPRQIDAAFSSGGGGGGGVTSVNGDTGAITIAAGTGITVTAPTAGTVEIAASGGSLAPIIGVNSLGSFPLPITLTGPGSSVSWGPTNYIPIAVTAGKTYLVTGKIAVEVTTLPAPGGSWAVSVARSAGGPSTAVQQLGDAVPAAITTSPLTLTFSDTFTAGPYTQFDVEVSTTSVDSGTELTFTLLGFQAVQLD